MGYLNRQLEKVANAKTLAGLLAAAALPTAAGATHGYLSSEADNKIPASILAALGAEPGATVGGMVGTGAGLAAVHHLPIPKRFAVPTVIAPAIAGLLGGGYLGAELGTQLGDKLAD